MTDRELALKKVKGLVSKSELPLSESDIDKAFSLVERMTVTVECSCGELFAQLSYVDYTNQMGGKPTEWFKAACRHWIDNRDHEINNVVRPLNQVVFSISGSLNEKSLGLSDEDLEKMFRRTFS